MGIPMTPTRPAAESAREEDSGARTASPGRILIVDDRPDKLLTMEAALAPLQHEIVMAGSGTEALRWLLRHDFAVVLLDVNMPGMDGFETARLIRRRRRNQDTPIIFITAYGDEMHALHGYSLGAVDFIHSPIIPAVLRSKVGVFLELYKRTDQVRRQARRLLAQTRQLQGLTRASLEIHAAQSIGQTLQFAADAARSVLEARRAGALVMPSPNGLRERHVIASPAHFRPALDNEFIGGLEEFVARLAHPVRLAPADFDAPALAALFPRDNRPAPAGLAAPLVDRDGRKFGLLVVAAKRDGDFSDDDEAVLVQLSQMAATAVENSLFAEARESNRIKDEFLATLSHELRTPLSSVLGWAQLLRAQMLDGDETAEALEIIERNAEMQCKLIEELLDVSRIVTGKLKLQIQGVALPAVIHAAVNVIRPAAQAKQVTIDVELDSCAAARLQGDADRLQQVFWNLLSNAVKFTPPGGQVRVTLLVIETQAEIVVADDGEGIAPEFLPFIFDRFRQADSTTSRRHGGLGIGLAIVRYIVELHGGTVRAESDGKGRGTRIVVTLPLQPARAGACLSGSGGLVRELQKNAIEHDAEPVLMPGTECGV
jgi:signal transduction histidine kinase/DNA-binding response OmpR family regulator